LEIRTGIEVGVEVVIIGDIVGVGVGVGVVDEVGARVNKCFLKIEI
jgi:hypothetical protein